MDVKYCPAQCGQFVLLPDSENNIFRYSNRNKSRINIYSQKILNYMNCHFKDFKEVGTKGKDISMENDSDIFANWIIQIYKDKGVKFFITNNYTILPVERFQDYFDISAKYRTKRSGSRNVGKKNVQLVMDYILNGIE